jgi:hypothetical protein
MKKVLVILVLAIVLAGSTLAIAAESKSPEASATTPDKAQGKSIFNSLSDFFSTFNRPFTRPGNKQGFCNATADWIRNINK